MVFANLHSHEKDAFFALLDEYFESRPELFSGLSDSSNNTSSQRAAATAAVSRAFASNPEATASLVSAGIRHGVPKSSPAAEAAANPEISNAVGRVAAASLAFHHNNNNNTSPTIPPPAPPRRGASQTRSNSPPAGLVSRRGFGNVDTSSKMSAFTSSFSKAKPPPSVTPPAPSAFTPKKNAFAPPPLRRTSSGSTPPPPPRRQVQAEEEEEEVQEEQGEWAEALYDYSSNDAGDLHISAGEKILVTERTSDDWWTGELDGRSGLFPASYVKVL